MILSRASYDALNDLARAFSDPWTARQVGQAMTCTEADTLAAVISLADPDAASVFLRGHANGEDHGDQPSDLHHHLRDDYNPDRHFYCGVDDQCLGCGRPDDDPRHIPGDQYDESDDQPMGVLTGLPAMPDPTPLPGETDHQRFHRASLLPWPSPLCVRCTTGTE